MSTPRKYVTLTETQASMVLSNMGLWYETFGERKASALYECWDAASNQGEAIRRSLGTVDCLAACIRIEGSRR